MAAFDHFGDMYDVALKPRLLVTLIRDHLQHPFSNPSELSKVVSLIKTHSLLSESVTESMHPKLIEAWKSAVDSWVKTILSLLCSTNTLDNWAGISLLGVTCEQCSSDRFLGFAKGSSPPFPSQLPNKPLVSYAAVWFEELLKFLKPQSHADSHLLRVAACASISDLFARLSGFPKSEKNKWSSRAVKVVEHVLSMLHDDYSEAIWEAAVHVLCTMITSFQSSINHHFGSHYKSVESAIAVRLLSGGCSLDILKKLAHCLALLPKSRGDEESWSLMMQKILILINDQLNLAFQGLEEETVQNEFNRLLVLPGKGFVSTEASNKATKRSEQSLMSSVSILMSGCCMMLTNTYPVKVNVPVRLLLTLVERILMVNGSLPEMSLPFMTAKQQENICSELPVLHLCSLELLTAIIKAIGSQLLPHAASIVRIITKYFKTCALPELRTKVYSVAKTLLISMGVGMALCLAQEVINNTIADLSTTENKNGETLNGSNSDVSTAALLPANHRKRKHSSRTGSLQEYDEGGGLGVKVPKNRPLTPISLRIAALEALESLITVAGALRSGQWRSQVDSLLIDIAKDSFKEGSSSEEINVLQQKESDATASDLQLAALRALLASFLSFARLRPPYLAQGLELFQRGKQQIGTKLAELCAHALLTLEVLIHPRALPLVDYACANNNTFGGAQSDFRDDYVSQNNSGLPQAVPPPDYDVDLSVRWFGNGDEGVGSLTKKSKYTQVPPSNINIQERSEMVSETATCADVEMRIAKDEINFKSDQPGDSVVQFQEPTSCIPVTGTGGDLEPERIVSDSTVPHMESGQGSIIVRSNNSSLQRTSDSNMVQDFEFKLNYDRSLVDEDDFPDIVDVDPDSE